MITIGKEIKLTMAEVVCVAHGETVCLDRKTSKILDERRRQIETFISASKRPSYGFNRGFGHNVDKAVEPHRLKDLQANLIRSHASGVGDPVPVEVVRATIFLRAQSLAQGHSGVRALIIERLLDLINLNIIPVVPKYGSVGASGDLAPLSHIALSLLGEGEVYYGSERWVTPAAEALEAEGLEPLELQMKEGLALSNGLQFSTALGILSLDKLQTLLRTAAVTTAVSAQVMLGSDEAFRPDLHALRPHPGALQVAHWIWNLMQDSPLRRSHESYETDGEIQDPYSIRCAGQVLGSCYDLLDEAKRTFEIEINSVTDNPLVLEDPQTLDSYTSIVSGGHFHGMPVAVKLYNLMQAMGIMARLSNMRCARYVDEGRNKGLGSDLVCPWLDPESQATSSGMMIPEYVTAALTNHIWGACSPSHLYSLSTDAGQEDHVSMSAGLAVRVWETIPRLAEVLGIELAFGAQAAAIRRQMEHFPTKRILSEEARTKVQDARDEYEAALRRELEDGDFDIRLSLRLEHHWPPEQRRLSEVCEKIVERVEEYFPTVTLDRSMSNQLRALADAVLAGEFSEIAQSCLTDLP